MNIQDTGDRNEAQVEMEIRETARDEVINRRLWKLKFLQGGSNGNDGTNTSSLHETRGCSTAEDQRFSA